MLVKNEYQNLMKSIPLIFSQEIDIPFKVIVIDSGSTDGSVEFINDYRKKCRDLDLICIPPEEFHHARTRNFGAAKANGRYVVFLGGDAVPCDTAWLRSLVKPLFEQNINEIACSYGRQIPKDDADISNFCRMSFNYPMRPLIKNKKSDLTRKELFFFSSVNACIDTQLCGFPLFDELVPVNEDVTLSYRIICAGYSIAYCPEAAVIHSHNYKKIDILRRYFDNGVVYKKIGIFPRKDRSVNRDGTGYLAHSFSILKTKRIGDWWAFFLFSLCAFIGVKLGMNHTFLPRGVAKALTKYNTV